MSANQSPDKHSAAGMSEEEVRKLARLARLSLSPEEVTHFAAELQGILGYVKKLDELDTSAVPPTLQVTSDLAPLRSDEVRSGVERAEVFGESPRSDDIGFLVPGFVD